MKNIKNDPINIIPIYIMSSFAAITMFVIYVFLSGKIISIPKGTHQGGIIGAIGVGVILTVMFAIMFGVLLLINRNKKRNNA